MFEDRMIALNKLISVKKKTEGVASNASNVCAAKANVSVSFYAEKEEPCM